MLAYYFRYSFHGSP